jgi:hypothetical protein
MRMTMVGTRMACTAMHTVMAITTTEAAASLMCGLVLLVSAQQPGVFFVVVTGCAGVNVCVCCSGFDWMALLAGCHG